MKIKTIAGSINQHVVAFMHGDMVVCYEFRDYAAGVYKRTKCVGQAMGWMNETLEEEV